MEFLMDEFQCKIIKPVGSIKKLVVFLHGYTSDVADVLPYAKILHKHLKDALIVIPEADMDSEKKTGKKQWYALLDVDPDKKRRQPETSVDEIIAIYNKTGLRISAMAKRVNRFITKLQKDYNISNKNTFVMGFSQGAMLALYTGLSRRYKLGGVFPFAGIVCGKDLLVTEHSSYPKVYLFHGKDDLSVQYKTLEFTKKWLKQQGVEWEAFEYDGLDHHLIEDEMVDAARIINKLD